MRDYYEIAVSFTRAALDERLYDECQTGITPIEARILHCSYEEDEKEEEAGHVTAYLLDPFASKTGIHDEADAQSQDVYIAAELAFKHGREGLHFNRWWDVGMPHGRVLYIDRADVKEKHRGKGLALLAMRRLIETFESNLVMLFAASDTDSSRLEKYYARLGFKKLKSRSKFVREHGSKTMYLDPSCVQPFSAAGWEETLVKNIDVTAAILN